jgi:hypothetical protein
VGWAFFPLDEELELLPGSLTPHAHECLVRLGAWIPFGKSGQLLAELLQVEVSAASSRRYTEGAGAAYEAVQQEEVERIERTVPPAPPGAERQLLSVDGAMVPLVNGEWAEVKTMVVGEVSSSVQSDGRQQVETHQLSYFSRLTDADSFNRLALVETHRRGVETASQVAAVVDGAEWIQGFVDTHRPDAVRILDFPHAAQRIAQISQIFFGDDGNQWLQTQLHTLKHEGPTAVLAELEQLTHSHPNHPLLTENLAYLRKRQAQMQYPTYQAQGWPIGSGAVESANKLVVEARLKGAGMHWDRSQVNPMLALRNIVCSDRWSQEWPQIVEQLRHQARDHRRQQQLLRRPQPQPRPLLDDLPVAALPDEPTPPSLPSDEPYRPPANHPWRHSPIGRARFRSYQKN